VFWLLLSLVVRAERVTVSIDSYKSASLSGDVPEGLLASFTNNGGTKGQVIANGSATLTVSNWPDATVQSITLYVRSNKTSGAATVSITMKDSMWIVADGIFNQWPGISGYSEDFIPLSALSKMVQIERDGVMTLQINGIKNSVYLQKMVVDYTTTPPVPYTVALQYSTNDGPQQISITETGIGEGVELPSVPEQYAVQYLQEETWYFYGWSKQLISTQPFSPLCWQKGDMYIPDRDITLYAIYTTSPEQTMRQNSSFVSGEYALVFGFYYDGIWALANQWKSGPRIAMHYVPVEIMEDGQLQWTVDTLAAQYRYSLQFMDDSVTVQNVATKEWIGYVNQTGSNRYCKWAWRKAKDGGLCLYANSSGTSPNQYYLTVEYDQVEKYPYATYRKENFDPNFSYWRLFPTKDIPLRQDAKYSSLIAYVALPAISHSVPLPTKTLDNNGCVIIHYQNKSYNILGNLLQ